MFVSVFGISRQARWLNLLTFTSIRSSQHQLLLATNPAGPRAARLYMAQQVFNSYGELNESNFL